MRIAFVKEVEALSIVDFAELGLERIVLEFILFAGLSSLVFSCRMTLRWD